MTDEHPDENQNLDAERIVAQAPATGDERVDDAVAGLSRLEGQPAEEHVAVLEEVHGRLRDILDDLDPSSPGQPCPHRARGSTPSWSGEAWPGRGSRQASWSQPAWWRWPASGRPSRPPRWPGTRRSRSPSPASPATCRAAVTSWPERWKPSAT